MAVVDDQKANRALATVVGPAGLSVAAKASGNQTPFKVDADGVASGLTTSDAVLAVSTPSKATSFAVESGPVG